MVDKSVCTAAARSFAFVLDVIVDLYFIADVFINFISPYWDQGGNIGECILMEACSKVTEICLHSHSLDFGV
eukprot:COSAG01_NODE_3921_length_5535_cov_44.878933_6_plen_72_part_00